MTAEGMPAAKDSKLAAPLAAVTRCVVRFPALVIAVSFALAALGACLAYSRLGYRTNRLDLLNPKAEYNRLWIEYLNEFGDEDDAVVVVEGSGPEHVVPVVQELATAIRSQPQLFHAVLEERDLAKIRAKGLHYVPVADLQHIEGFLNEAGPIVDGDWSRLKVGTMAAGLCWRLQATRQAPPEARQQAAGVAAQQIDAFAGSLLANLGPEHRYVSPWPNMPKSLTDISESSADYLSTKEGKLGFVLLRLAPGKDTFARCSESTDALRRIMSQVQARHRETQIGLTGLPVMENDEMRSSKTSMTWAMILSLVGVLWLLIAAFGGFRHALLANLALIVAIAWSFGYATLTVGHLNILSVAFTVTLNGLGIDYGVYVVARYVQLRNQGRDRDAALIETSRTVGPAVVIGAITTAAGFFAAVLTSFTGIVELGIIAGGGILLCALAELVLLPALICLADQAGFEQPMPKMLAVHHWIKPVMRASKPVLVGAALATLLLGIGIRSVWYDHNLLDMQARGLQSVELERKLLSQCNRSTWYALSIADSREELLARKAKFDQLKTTVERTEEIVSLLPGDDALKQPIIERIQKRLAGLPERPPAIGVDAIGDLGTLLAQTQQAALQLPGSDSARQLEQIRDLLRRRPAEECSKLLCDFQQQVAGDLLTRLHTLRDVANPEAPQSSDLPESLVNRFIGHSGKKYLLKVYGRGDIWDMAGLRRFVWDVRQVDPKITGNPLQAYEASREIKKSYEQASIYALLVIVAVLMLEFRSTGWMLLATLPTALGIVQMFGLMGFLNLPLNAANLIALPIIMGVGVDYALQVVFDFRAQIGRRYQMAPSTALAVLVDGLTTVVGFGSFMIATHQGLQSLGRVLTIGVSCCLFNSLFVLPALLTWATRKQPSADSVVEIEAAEVGDEQDSKKVEMIPPAVELIRPRPRTVVREAA